MPIRPSKSDLYIDIEAEALASAKAGAATLGNLELLRELGGTISTSVPAASILARAIVTIKTLMMP